MRTLLLSLFTVLVTACAPVQHTSSSFQQTNKELYAGKGDTVLRIDQKKALPNAFGKADIFGRTTNTGMVIVQFLGMEGNKALLQKSELIIESNDSTMSRTGLMIPKNDTASVSGFVGTTPVMMSASRQSYQYIPPKEVRGYGFAAKPILIEVDTKKEREVYISGYKINILESKTNHLKYKIEKVS